MMAPMNNRLMRPRQSGYVAPDADARAYIARVEEEDGQKLEPAIAKAINDFVAGLKTDGDFDKLKACCILMGARTLDGALEPLVGGDPSNNNFVGSLDYDRKLGLKGNNSNKTLNTNRANNADTPDNNHMAVYVTAADTGDGAYMASGAGVTGNNQFLVASGTTLIVRNRTTSNLGNTFAANPTGFIGQSRAASGSYTVRYSGANTNVNLASQTPNSANVLLYDIPSFSGFVSDARISFYSIGESLTLANLDTRVSALYTAIGAAIP